MEKLTFKGKEFKGSEGEFYITDYAGYLCLSNGEYYGDADLLSCEDVSEKIAQANARLFANSKNLLKAAIDVVKAQNNWELTINERQKFIEQLETEILKSL